MCYAEASYFDGYAFAHIAARDEHMRLTRIAHQNRMAVERRRRTR